MTPGKNEPFLLFILHPKDVNSFAEYLIGQKLNIESHFDSAGISNYVFDIKDFKTIQLGGHYQNGIQKDGINPKIYSADMFIVIVENSEGKSGFKEEIRILREQKKAFCLLYTSNRDRSEKIY